MNCTTHHHACECREAQMATLIDAMADLLEEYEDRSAQFGDDYLWEKHEDKDTIETARTLLREWKETK